MIKISFYDDEKHFCAVNKDDLVFDFIKPYVDRGIFKIDQDKIVFPYSILGLLKNIFVSTLVEFDTSTVDAYYERNHENFDISDKMFLRDDQYDMITNNIVKHYRGIVQCRTGMGKTETMIYLAKTCKVPGNKLILTNNNQVATEIEMRFKKYGINPDDLNLRIYNPISLMNSNKAKDPELKEFCSKVSFVQIDELESVTTSLKELLQYCPYKILYGYSASPEKVKGLDLRSPDSILQVNEDAVGVLKLAGFALAYSAPEKPLTINIVETYLADEWFPPWVYNNDSQGALVIQQKLSQGNLFKKNVMFKVLDQIVLPNTEQILFIPFRFIEHGDQLFEHYKNTKYRIVQWDGEKIRSNIPGMETLKQSDIKQLTIDRKFDILTASAVANRGVDFRNMKDILLFIHTQYSNVIQSIGRLSREAAQEKANIWLIHNLDNNTPFYSKMSTARFNRIKVAYQNAEIIIKKWKI
ncbi:MAG: DEAD/DEAH box helicase family protein [Paludibacteraceae bacterium]|nr:DEAD/DEAH box helicase family protein [Paludibacteraceae bacterium]